MLSLGAAGVRSIDLAGTAVVAATGLDEAAVVNRGRYTRTDGAAMQFLDVALAYRPGAPYPFGAGVRDGNDTDAAPPDAADADRLLAVMAQDMAVFGARSGDAGMAWMRPDAPGQYDLTKPPLTGARRSAARPCARRASAGTGRRNRTGALAHRLGC